MLRELRVKNFAIVEDGRIVLGPGMNAFTGETGAGKSLLLSAITLLLGAKAENESVRQGAKSAEVEGVFDLKSVPEKIKKAQEMGFDFDEDNPHLFLVRREISAQGSSYNRIWIQGKSSTRRELQEVLGDWVEISGQHEFLRLGREDYLFSLLDRYANLEELVKKYRQLRIDFLEAQAARVAFEKKEEEKVARLDYLSFQVEEFSKAGVHESLPEEEINWSQQQKRLANGEKIKYHLNHCIEWLEGGTEDRLGAQEALHKIEKEIVNLENLGMSVADLKTQIHEASKAVEELSYLLQKESRQWQNDPEALEEVEKKLALVHRLKRKYNCEVSTLVEIFSNAKNELESLQKSDEHKAELIKKEKETFDLAVKIAQKLDRERQTAIEKMNSKLQKELKFLGMSSARIAFEMQKENELGEFAFNKLSLLFSANPGEKMGSVAALASGGELSRIMLALKNLVAGQAEVGVYLFDEVDAGIGGETAQRVGERLRQIAHHNQVLVVTHLAQVAAFAHTQFTIQKKMFASKTRTVILSLNEKERQEEIARMLGSTKSKAAKSLAIEMLKQVPAE